MVIGRVCFSGINPTSEIKLLLYLNASTALYNSLLLSLTNLFHDERHVLICGFPVLFNILSVATEIALLCIGILCIGSVE